MLVPLVLTLTPFILIYNQRRTRRAQFKVGVVSLGQ